MKNGEINMRMGENGDGRSKSVVKREMCMAALVLLKSLLV